jgi:hypothetical protein
VVLILSLDLAGAFNKVPPVKLLEILTERPARVDGLDGRLLYVGEAHAYHLREIRERVGRDDIRNSLRVPFIAYIILILYLRPIRDLLRPRGRRSRIRVYRRH